MVGRELQSMPQEKTEPTILDVQAEVLPAKGRVDPSNDEKQVESEISKNVAHWLDELIRIPGTNIRIGLDPIIGLFPGVGDLIASSMGMILLLEGVRLKVPVSVLFRMGLNVLVNDAVGSIPGIGDLFSAFFKSNSRNVKLLNRWKAGDQASVRKGSRVFLAGFAVVWIGLLFVWVSLWVMIVKFIWGLF